LLTESVLLSLIGGAVGAVVALWGVDLLTKFKPSDNAQFWTAYTRTFDFHKIAIDGQVLAFNFGLAVATGLLFGLLPAWQASRAGINEALKDSRTGALTGLYRRVNARSLLVVSEIALSLVLLAGAGLMINSLIRLNSVRLGFDPQNVLTMRVYSRDAKLSFYEQLLERTSSLPGVISASVATSAPLYGFGSMSPMYFEGEQETEASRPRFVAVHSISQEYFNTLGIGLIKGRNFTEQDRIGAKRVAIINQEAAAQYWLDEEPVGKRFRLASRPDYPNADEFVEIVGISDNIKYGRVEELSEPEVYLSVLQPVDKPSLLIVRAVGEQESLVSAIRREVKLLDKNLPVYNVKSMTARAAEVTSRTRFSALVLALFAGVALILSGVGIYGVMAYTVAGRTKEIGIRIALGARAGDVFRLVCGQGIVLTIAGLTIGLIGAYAGTRMLASQLYDVSATDPITFVAISIVLVGVALGACFVPARRATKVDPMVALRYE
jgi:putative ABC transport system permease protein